MSDNRLVLVDDADPDISYVGPWFTDTGSLDSMGNNGPPYLSTLHGVNSPGSMTYTFNGSRVLVVGTVQFLPVNGSTSPSYQCIIDENVVDSSTNIAMPNNRLHLCAQDGLDDTLHTITVKADVPNNHTFWLDYIEYLPLPSVPLDAATVSIPPIDPHVLMGGWEMMDAGYMTQRSDSTFSFDFYGVSLAWYGFYNNTLPAEPTTGTYSIDEQDPVSFDLDAGVAADKSIQYNQIMFQIAQLPAAPHRLEVTYGGDLTKTPLSLALLVVQNGTNASATDSTTTSASSLVSSTTLLPSNTNNGTSTVTTATNNNTLSSISTSASVGVTSSTATVTMSISSSVENDGGFRNRSSSTSFIQPSPSRTDDNCGTGCSTTSSTISSTPPAPTSTNADDSSTWAKNARTAMIGGMGALVVIFISLFIFLCLRRRGRNFQVGDEKGHVVEPYTYSSLHNSRHGGARRTPTPNFLQRTSKFARSLRHSDISTENNILGSSGRAGPFYLIVRNPSSETSINRPRDNDSGLRFPNSANSSVALLPPGYTTS